MLINYEKTRGSGAIVTDCLNLRPDRRGDTGVLVPAGVPKIVAPTGYMPIVADGDYLLASRGNTIYAFCTRGEAGEPREVTTLAQPARCGLRAGGNIWIMTEEGAVRLKAMGAGNYAVAEAPVQWPGVTLTGVRSHTVEAEVMAGDIGTLGARLCDAYAELDRQAAATGTLLQPVVARVRIVDGEGRTLHVGPPVLVSGPKGAQLCGQIRLETDGTGDERTTRARMLDAEVWQMRVSIADTLPSPWRELAARLEVEITPQFHPYDRAARPIVASVRESANGDILVTMPGCTRGLAGGDTASSEARLRAVTERFDALASVVASIPHPYVGGADTTLSVSRRELDAEVEAVERALLSAPATKSYDEVAVGIPHAFTATSGAANASTVLWADARAVPFGGYDAAWFATSRGTRSWLGSVAVEFADGSRVVSTCSGRDNPTVLSPMLSYPLPSAVRLTISVHADGDARPAVVSVTLRPDATGTRAVWTADDLQPVPLTDFTAYQPPVAIAGSTSGPLLVAAKAEVANTATAAIPAPAIVTAVAPVGCSSATRDNQPAHFYVATTSAINVVTATAGAGALSAAHLADGGVDGSRALIAAGECAYALSDGNILKLKNMNVETVASGLEGIALSHDSRNGEIMVINPDDNECVHLLTRHKMMRYHTSLVASGAVTGTFAVTAEGIADLAQRRVGAQTHIAWRTRYMPDNAGPVALKKVEWQAKGSDVHLTMSTERTWLTDGVANPGVLASAKVDGRLLSPVAMPLNTHAVREVALHVTGTVSPDFAITRPILQAL